MILQWGRNPLFNTIKPQALFVSFWTAFVIVYCFFIQLKLKPVLAIYKRASSAIKFFIKA